MRKKEISCKRENTRDIIGTVSRSGDPGAEGFVMVVLRFRTPRMGNKQESAAY